MPPKPSFPIIEGGCLCGLIRYRLLDSPLFCHACHCSDCQRKTGTAFSSSCVIEFDRVVPIGKGMPQVVRIGWGGEHRTASMCPDCKSVMWNSGTVSPYTTNIAVGTLDLPGLMEPDAHIYVDAKVAWLPLPKDARLFQGDVDLTTLWPANSLRRLKAALERWEARNSSAGKVLSDGEIDGEDKTPTNGSPEEKFEDEDDDEFDKRTDEIENALQERLEKLSLKLKEQEKEVVAEQKTA